MGNNDVVSTAASLIGRKSRAAASTNDAILDILVLQEFSGAQPPPPRRPAAPPRCGATMSVPKTSPSGIPLFSFLEVVVCVV